MRRALLLLLAIVFLAGCQTPGPVRDLANRTAVHTALVDRQLKEMGRQSRAIAEMRATRIVQQRAVNREVAARNALDEALLKKTEPKALSARADIVKWIATTQEIFESSHVDQVAEVRAILSEQKTAASQSKGLGEVAAALTKLGKKDDVKTRSKFMFSYTKEVAKLVKETREAAEKASAEAIPKTETAGDSGDGE